MKHLFLIGTILMTLIAAPLKAAAEEAPPKVVISEVDWAGSAQSSADEWLELQNLEEEAIDLSLWSIEGAATSNGVLTLPGGTLIEARGTYLIANYGAGGSTLAVEAHYVTTAVALSNSAFKLTLKDAVGNVVDAVGDGGTPEAGTTGSAGYASMIRVDEGWVTANTSVNFDSGVTQFGTPGVGDIEIETEVAAEEVPPVEEPEAIEEPVVEPVDEPPLEEPAEELVVEQDPEVVDEAPVIIEEPIVETPPEEVPEEEPVEIPSYSPGDLLIGEIVSDPDEGNESVEIVNPGTEAIDLTGWSVTEAGG
ncbi:MAG: lamin tail domain-containing protein, partial [Patescibacteria group bacterium]